MAEFDVASSATSSQIITLDDGNVVVAWVGTLNGEKRVWTQTFTAEGTAVTQPTAVSAVSTSAEGVSMALLADGSIAYSWTQSDGAGYLYESKARVLESDGTVVTDITPVNTTTYAQQWQPKVVALDDGGFVVAFVSAQGTGTSHDGSGSGIRARIFDADGVAIQSADFIVNTVSAGDQGSVRVAAVEGGFVAVFESPDTGGSPGIRAKIFANDGTTVVDEFVITDSAKYDSGAAVTTRAGGGFVVTWYEMDENTSAAQVKAMAYGADGKALWTAPADVTTGTLDVSLDVIELADGRILAFYGHYSEDYSNITVYAQVIETDGSVSAPAVMIGGGGTAYIDNVAVDFLDDATLVMTWTDGATGISSVRTIEVADVADVENTAPTDIQLSKTSISEMARAGFEVGVLSATDADGDDITWSLDSTLGDNGDFFKLRSNEDGTVSVVLKNPISHESISGGKYDLVVTATDSEGNATTETIEITALDEPLKFSGSPTGKGYAGIVENAPVGQEIGHIFSYESDFEIASVTLSDDADGLFDIKSRTVDGVKQYYLVTTAALDYESATTHAVTFSVTDTEGEVYEKTVEVNVLDAAETGDTARGTITIDAGTMLAKKNGGVNWDSYIDDYYAKVNYSLPNLLPTGTGWNQSNPATEFVYGNGETLLSMRGADLVYNWTDPVTGEDTHVVSGTIEQLVFGDGEYLEGVSDIELSISGLDLSNNSDPLNRIYGDTNLTASAFMHGPNDGSPAEIEYVKALLSSYAQNFIGSAGNDTYSGTIFDDTIDGGGGMDRLYGGAGADAFLFARGDTGKQKSQADTIYDFVVADGDTIDLSAIDANSRRAADQEFRFIGGQGFHDKAGELRVVTQKSDTWILGDTDGNGRADFIIHLDDAVKLRAEHFAL